MHSTCFLQSSCMCTSCPLPTAPPVEGVWQALAPQRHDTLQTVLITHAGNCQLIAPPPVISSHSYSVYAAKVWTQLCMRGGGRESVFWFILAWLQGGLGSHGGLTAEGLQYCSALLCSGSLLWVFPSLWVNLQPHSGQTMEKMGIKSGG